MQSKKTNTSTEIRLRNKNPQAREQLAHNTITEFLDRNPNGVTVKQIASKTEISRTTVVRHLERLVALRKARKRDFGYVALYYKEGYTDEENAESDTFSNGTSFTLQLVNRDAGEKFVYVQEKQLGDFREEKVVGGIMVNVKDVQRFIKLFHAYTARIVDLESGK